MSVLDDFARIRLYRERASQFEWLADNEPISNVRLRYRVIARHYSELAYRDEQADKTRMAERIGRLKLERQKKAAQGSLTAKRDAQLFLIAAE
jgi:hypothetical protein